MNLKEYLELDLTERAQFQELIKKHLRFDVDKFHTDVQKSIMEIETYIADRMRDREKLSTITFPEKLSKKEAVICRLKMMKEMLKYAPSFDDDADTMHIACRIFIASVLADLYSHKSVKEGNKWTKWEGLSPPAAELLNCIYTPLLKCYERKFKI